MWKGRAEVGRKLMNERLENLEAPEQCQLGHRLLALSIWRKDFKCSTMAQI